MTRIHTRSESPVERKLTEIETRRVRDGETGGIDFVIEQSTYKVGRSVTHRQRGDTHLNA